MSDDPADFLGQVLALPVLQPLTPVWGRQLTSAPDGKPVLSQISFPRWQQHPASAFRRPEWNRPPASAPALSVFAPRVPARPNPGRQQSPTRGRLSPGRQRWEQPERPPAGVGERR